MVNEWLVTAFMAGVVLDFLIGDPSWLPHPVVGYGKIISSLEHKFNKGDDKQKLKNGAFVAIALILATFIISSVLLALVIKLCAPAGYLLITIGVFFCLAGTTLLREVRGVFQAVSRSTEEGRKQVARIVGRDTQSLDNQEICTAALETLAENLSDGVVAPLFWFAVLGLPGMLTYKMVNTLDSMIGYKSDRYMFFGRIAAKIDDVFNYIPARLTAGGMILVSGRLSLFEFVKRFGRSHASPNSGYPEAALAGILNCRFGGPHDYFGREVWKPWIGTEQKTLTNEDLVISVKVCRRTIILFVILTGLFVAFI
ncbi:MAG: adenosylcobinamide-phosphate synthase CbiB [Paramuribaculum sp.]|nr:adenosylcobinamide-phosphate synthase CbiB [Paramuribaculum sp.]